MLDFVNTETFQDFAQFRIHPWKGWNFTTDILRKNAIIYCKTDFIPLLFQNLQLTNRKYILITHSSDYPINKDRFNSKPSCIIKWFAENATYDHSDLIPIPIGLIPSNETNRESLEWFSENIEVLRSNPKDKDILYCNWNNANISKGRFEIFEKLRKNNLKYIWDRPETEDRVKLLLEKGSDSVGDQRISFNEYCDHLSRHRFIISPPGNGEDTHRTWESLYMGCFPIVKKNNIFKEYKDLPIIQINDYSEINYNLLNSFLNREYNYDILYMKYWKTRILEEFNKL